MKIVFFGTPDFVKPVISVLKSNFELVQVINKPEELNRETIEELKTLSPDLFVVGAYGQILPKEVLDIPKLGVINIHPSLLPKYRGASPIQTAILNGDEKTGVSFIKMDEKMDHGPIIYQFEENVLETDTFKSLAERLFAKSAEELEEVINRFSSDSKLTNQDETQATYTKLITRQDGYIDLSKLEIRNLKLEIARRIRAYFPWPGVWTKYKLSEKELVIKLLPNSQIQVEGKKPMSYKDFMNGYPNGKEFLQKLSLF
jgi:methionyl-tRNA formyltransferase